MEVILKTATRISVLLISLMTASAHAVVLDRIVAVVGNEAITERDVTLAMRNTRGPRVGKDAHVLSRNEALETLIQDALLAQAMVRANIVVNEEDINRAMRNVMAQHGMSNMDQLRATVAKQGITFDQYRENLKRHIQQMKFINQEIGSQVKISDQDLEDYYRQHMKKFSGTSAIHIAEIIFPFPEPMTEDAAKALQAQIRDVASKLTKGNFKQMAKKYSKGPNADQGGDLGVVDPKTLQPEVAAAVIPLRAGEITQPIVTKTGVIIAMALERSEATDKDFERLKDQIYNILYEQRMQDVMKAFVSQLRQNSYVQVND
jgi:peptidyl-prolyl cis-trans isomerase SurA